jgi:hypothetical protein
MWKFIANIYFLCRPKKVKPETSPEVLKSLEAKLAAMALEQEPGIAETA